jgi:hypothetical protein
VSFLGVSERLLGKYCSEKRICFWGLAGLIEPIETRELYLFDCSLFKYAREEFREHPELRVLLSFRAGVLLNNIWFTSQLGYYKLSEAAPCTVSDIEKCLNESFKALDAKIEEYYGKVKYSPSREFLRFIIPTQSQRAELRGIYHGLLLRKKILKEIAGNMGYESGVLKSNVKPVYVLYSVDPVKWEFTALISDKHSKLEAHRKIIDKNKLLTAIRKTPE